MATSSYPGPRTGGLYQWLDERLSLGEIAAFAKHKTVPQHKQCFWYYWGGISLFLFILQLFSGIMLLVYFARRTHGRPT
jgi:cytochrome b6